MPDKGAMKKAAAAAGKTLDTFIPEAIIRTNSAYAVAAELTRPDGQKITKGSVTTWLKGHGWAFVEGRWQQRAAQSIAAPPK